MLAKGTTIDFNGQNVYAGNRYSFKELEGDHHVR